MEIDEEFDDYIECDYWDFTLMAIRKWKLEKDLYASLEGSLALILETLQRYSDSCVKRISAYAAKMRTKAE